jgi:hypothetical protein
LALAKMRSFGSLREFVGGGPKPGFKVQPAAICPVLGVLFCHADCLQGYDKGMRLPRDWQALLFFKKGLDKN